MSRTAIIFAVCWSFFSFTILEAHAQFGSRPSSRDPQSRTERQSFQEYLRQKQARETGKTETSAPNQEKSKPVNSAPFNGKTAVVPLKHTSANDVAKSLQKLFERHADVHASAETRTNSLLIVAPEKAIDSIVATAKELDRPARMVKMTILLAMTSESNDMKKDNAPAIKKDNYVTDKLSGTIPQVLTHMEMLQKEGKIKEWKTINITTRENQPGMFQVASEKPMVTGVSIGAGGRGGFGGTARSMSYRPVGTKVDANPVILPNQVVQVDLNVELSDLVTASDAPVLATGENGEPIRAAETVIGRSNSSVQITPGQAVLAGAMQVTGRSTQSRVLVVIYADFTNAE